MASYKDFFLAGYNGSCLESHLLGRQRQEDHGLRTAQAKKLAKPYFNDQARYMPTTTVTQWDSIGEITVQGWSRQKSTRPWKIRAKRAGCMANMVECLPSKCKSLRSKPSTRFLLFKGIYDRTYQHHIMIQVITKNHLNSQELKKI
jgi:hypothetical protein